MKEDVLKIDENGHVIDIENNCVLILSGVDKLKPYHAIGDSIKNTEYMVQCINSHGPLCDMLNEFVSERVDNDTWKEHELTIKAHEYLSMLNGDKSKIRSLINPSLRDMLLYEDGLIVQEIGYCKETLSKFNNYEDKIPTKQRIVYQELLLEKLGVYEYNPNISDDDLEKFIKHKIFKFEYDIKNGTCDSDRAKDTHRSVIDTLNKVLDEYRLQSSSE